MRIVPSNASRATLHHRGTPRMAGVAIISVLLTVALATIVVSGLFLREHVTVRSVENRSALTQSRWVERAAIDWSKVILAADGRVAGKVDHLGEPWAVPVAETRLDETVTAGARIDDDSRVATLSGQMLDAQARLNLNFLIERGMVNADGSIAAPGQSGTQTGTGNRGSTPLARGSTAGAPGGSPTATGANTGPWGPSTRNIAVFAKLLDTLGLPGSIASTVTQRLLASRQDTTNTDEERQVALPLMRTVDLLGLRGIDAAVVEALDPFVIFLPMQPGGSFVTPVNVNTAPAEVLTALVADLDLSSARRIVTQRERKWFNTIEEFRAALALSPSNTTLRSDLLTVKTQYFLVRGLIRFGRVESFTETLLHRQTQRVEVIWQRRL